MDNKCKVEDLTVDGSAHGSVVEIEGKFYPSDYRQPSLEDIFCSNCGEYLLGGTNDTVDEAVRKHLKS